MGVIFLLIFTAYITIQAFATKLYGDELGSNMALTLYAVFTAACFIAPAITNVLGPRFTLFLGSLGYAALVMASLVFALAGSSAGTQALVILGGACCGLGAALLWTAQGRMMLEWSNGVDQGAIFAIFWALFNMSALVGGMLTYCYFAEHDIEDQKNLWPLYVVFLSCIIVGGAFTQLLSAGSHGGHETTSALTPEAPPVNGALVAEVHPPRGGEPSFPATMDWYTEAKATIRLFGTRTMVILGPLMWYTGFNQPYQLNTFGDRFFAPRALGIEVIVFYGAEIIGGFAAGWLLDRDPTRPRHAALRQLAIFMVVTTGGYLLALPSELSAARDEWPESDVAPLRLNETAILPPTAAYALWGLSDSQIQAYSYWLMRHLFADGPEQSRAVGFYKMIQSLGWCVGFAIVPASRVPPIIQMGLTFACAVLGVVLALFRLPSTACKSAADRLDGPLLTSNTAVE